MWHTWTTCMYCGVTISVQGIILTCITCGNNICSWYNCCCWCNKGWHCWQKKYNHNYSIIIDVEKHDKVNTMNDVFPFLLIIVINFHSPGINSDCSLHCPLPALSAPLTLKEYTTPVCSVSTMYCDVVFMFMMLLVLVLVTSTWYTTTHWLSRDQVRLTDDPASVVLSRLKVKLFGYGGGPEDYYNDHRYVTPCKA